MKFAVAVLCTMFVASAYGQSMSEMMAMSAMLGNRGSSSGSNPFAALAGGSSSSSSSSNPLAALAGSGGANPLAAITGGASSGSNPMASFMGGNMGRMAGGMMLGGMFLSFFFLISLSNVEFNT